MCNKRKENLPLHGFMYKIAKKLCLGNSLYRYLFYKYINRFEGGQFYSPTLRKIFSEVYDISVGFASYGCFTTNFRPHVRVGNYCSIAPNVQRLVGNHPMTDVSTHPIFHIKDFGYVPETRYEDHTLNVGHDVWIGVNAIITGKCEEIGNGAVIGAGAVVTKNVEPYTIVAGSPAKVIGIRFTPEEREILEESKWFLKTPDDLAHAIKFADNVKLFVEAVNNGAKQ